MATGEGGGLPSVSLVLRRGGAWGESSLILCYCYFWLHRRLIPARDPSHFLVSYRPLATPFAARARSTRFCRRSAERWLQVIALHHILNHTRYRGPGCEVQTQMKPCQQPLSMVRARLRPNEWVPFNAHPPRSRARNERPARGGSRPSGARGPDAALRPGRAFRQCPRMRRARTRMRRAARRDMRIGRARRNTRALRRSIRRRSRPSSASCGRSATRWPRRRRTREERLLGDSVK